ncbi:DNA alkylation repair protein [Algoriphagus aestuariicola]|uniref:DNA alkylation repair protein n=1 Tax=Algoriphagus aestuariicola TaxID=1852016 RepID=A0ABS3BS93_9BACT|nr:DNA alkylation repair protein [Algoriphagus aestuariicola]MBN7801983.1 DNA alkylation repair protein [Algoriphagus aestuariicola]
MSLLTEQIIHSLQDRAIPEKAAFFPQFFKAGPGEYGEGDLFLGVKVPDQRRIAKGFYREIPLGDLSELIQNPYHEVRLTALIALVYRYEKSKTEAERQELADFYLHHLDWVNNWDLVDTSCHPILGHFYWNKDKALFYHLAGSHDLWRQRVAMISSLYWIKKGDFDDALALAEDLKNHPHDLMHKAVGWMLREIGNLDFEAEMAFLKQHYRSMPRTALRYAIEKFPEDLRQDFLKGRI